MGWTAHIPLRWEVEKQHGPGMTQPVKSDVAALRDVRLQTFQLTVTLY